VVPRLLSEKQAAIIGVSAHVVSMLIFGLAPKVRPTPPPAQPPFPERLRLSSYHTCVRSGFLVLSTKGWVLPIALLSTAVSGLKVPAFMSLLTCHAAPEERGMLQGALQSLRALSQVRSPPPPPPLNLQVFSSPFIAFWTEVSFFAAPSHMVWQRQRLNPSDHCAVLTGCFRNRQAIGAPIYGFLLSWALEKTTISRYGIALSGLPFVMAAGTDIIAVLTTLAAFRAVAKLSEEPRSMGECGLELKHGT
jgi:hypothetical protein